MDGVANCTRLSPTAQAMLTDTIVGLSRPEKSLSPKWLYDHRGSALFEQITALPEYDLTRNEARILREHAGTLAGLVPRGGAFIEFGSGASVKTRTLLDKGGHFGVYVPVDISEAFLHETADHLRGLYPTLQITPVVADFLDPIPLPQVVQGMAKVGFFPGSTIGNLTPERAVDLLANARGWDGARRFILGADLVKDEVKMVQAYDDAQGVTADFISNILIRLNRELGSNFDLGAFVYRATWNEVLMRIDMQLVSRRAQRVEICDREFEFAEGEPVHISASRKYTLSSLRALVQKAGWQLDEVFTDPKGYFAVAVLSV